MIKDHAYKPHPDPRYAAHRDACDEQVQDEPGAPTYQCGRPLRDHLERGEARFDPNDVRYLRWRVAVLEYEASTSRQALRDLATLVNETATTTGDEREEWIAKAVKKATELLR